MKRFLIFAAIVIAVLGGIAAAVPLALSTPAVKQRIADQIADWSGRKVSFIGNPGMGVFPYFRLSIHDVTIGDPERGGPFLAIKRLTTKMRILPLLVGRIEVAEFRLQQPMMHVRRDAAGRGNWAFGPAPREQKRAGPTTLLKLSRIHIADGSIIYEDAATGRHEEVTAATLSLSWPSAGDPMVGTGTFKWRAETVEFNGSIGDPIALNEGKVSPARFAVASTPIRASFSGNVSRLADLQIEGPATVSTPSLRRLIAWLGSPMEAGSILGAASIEGNVNWRDSSIAFSAAHAELDGNIAEGVLSANFGEGRPRIEGTLAFDKLDLSPYLEAFRAELHAAPWASASISMPALSALDVDLRLSTDQILMGPARMGNVAITAGVKQGKLAIEIGEAQLYSGTLAATLTAEMQGERFVSDIEARMSGVPAGVALTDLAGLKSIDGTGAATIKVSGSGASWGEFAHKLAGTAKLTLADGTFAGLDMARVAALLGGTASGTSNGSTAFSSAACNLTIAGGAITTDNLRAEGEDFQIDLAGEASLFNPTVSGRGTLTLGKAGGSSLPKSALPFELSGTWQEPELFPDLGRVIKRSSVEPSRPRG